MIGMQHNPGAWTAPGNGAFGDRDVPTLRPMAGPWRGVVAIADTNALASRACHAVREGHSAERLFAALAATGRSPVYASPHVLVELHQRLPAIAEKTKVDFAAARAMLWGPVIDAIRIVELEIGDHLAPGIRPLMRADPTAPRRQRGDPDDLGTAALAEFLAPAVILSADDVFHRFGLANTTADTWLDRAYRLLDAARVEARVGDVEALADIAVELVLCGIRGAIHGAQRAPLVAVAVIAVTGIIASRTGNLRLARWRERARAVAEWSQPLIEELATALERHAQARGQLLLVEASSTPTTTQLAARHLARCGGELTPAELRDALARRGHRIPATRLKAAMLAHRAFVRLPGDRFLIGRPVRPPADWVASPSPPEPVPEALAPPDRGQPITAAGTAGTPTAHPAR
jgi:hypothetical protein